MTNGEQRVILEALDHYLSYWKHKMHKTHLGEYWSNIKAIEDTRESFLKSIRIKENDAA